MNDDFSLDSILSLSSILFFFLASSLSSITNKVLKERDKSLLLTL
ncbi:unnamed protein product [Spirodela intermedia]|uniref:NADH dehydrogenase subunit 5 n=1 Tax=Spirodela intermedia TaxID=51605 RepID=A0ABN7EAM4_SPIIN|nr:unnamed protein product [Spirodela intermedia]